MLKADQIAWKTSLYLKMAYSFSVFQFPGSPYVMRSWVTKWWVEAVLMLVSLGMLVPCLTLPVLLFMVAGPQSGDKICLQGPVSN